VEDSEIFDDTDFYHQMLRDVIESETEGVSDPVALGKRFLALKKLKNKQKLKKKVDQKASKGRRLRYDIHPLLVSFVPIQTKTPPPVTDELLSNLFK